MFSVDVFVSYARSDGEISRRIADRLELAGHSVWIDTDDIVGSERWRASIGSAITNSDVVLLVVSSASMQSENVEREVTVAAEQDRPIVPAVVETADVPVGLLYDLAGVQRVSFVDRPFDDAIVDLDEALRLSVATSPDRPTRDVAANARTAGKRERPNAWRTLLGLGALGAVVVGAALLLRPTDDGGSAVAPERTHVSSTDVDRDGVDGVDGGVVDVELNTSVWFAGFLIQARAVRVDPGVGTVGVDVMFTNEQYGRAQPCALLFDHAALVVDDRRYQLSDDCDWLPPATSNPSTLEATVDDDIDLSRAALVFGSPEQHQAVIPLDGGAGTSESPTSAPLAGDLDTDRSTFAAERVDVVPATCAGLSDTLTFDPARTQEMSVVVTGSATSSSEFPLGYGTARLTLPDGTDLASDSLWGVIYLLDPGETLHEVRACFSVPAPVSGAYQFSITYEGSETFPDPLTITF